MKLLRKILLLLTLSIFLPLGLANTPMDCQTVSDLGFKGLQDSQPYVTDLYPPGGSLLQDPVFFILNFSERISLPSLSDRSLTLVYGELKESLKKDTQELMDQIHTGELEQIHLSYYLEGDERTLSLFPIDSLSDGLYHLIVTPEVRSIQGIPFNQNPGQDPTAFVASFALGEGQSLPSNDNNLGEPTPAYGPAPELLIINEILYDGLLTETDGEAFVEIYGTPGADISAFKISFINGADGKETDRVVFPDNTLLPNDGILLVADRRTHSDSASQVLGFDLLDNFDPQNGPDTLHLMGREGRVWDALAYGEGAPFGEGSPAIDVGGGHSLSRLGGVDSNDNFIDFIELEVPSPGSL